MERLTEKAGDEYIPIQNKKIGYKACMKKLAMLEDLEEQIGMPLDVWHHIYDGNPIYFIGNEPKPIELFLHDNCMRSFKFSLSNESVVYVMLHASDYKKYWFLSHEEAEKKLEEMKNEGLSV